MPFKKRGLTMFRDWEPDIQFNRDIDRLLVTTSRGDTFVAATGPEADDGTTFVVDKQFMPQNLAELPHQLMKVRPLPLEWDASAFPWEIFLHDGEMTDYGPFLLTEAVGIGWQCTMSAHFTITCIDPVRVDEIDRTQLARTVRGLQFGIFNVDELAIYNQAIRF